MVIINALRMSLISAELAERVAHTMQNAVGVRFRPHLPANYAEAGKNYVMLVKKLPHAASEAERALIQRGMSDAYSAIQSSLTGAVKDYLKVNQVAFSELELKARHLTDDITKQLKTLAEHGVERATGWHR